METLNLHRETLATAVGEVVLLTDDEGKLRALDFADFEERTLRLLDRHYGRGRWRSAQAGARTRAFEAVRAYFEGEVTALDALAVATGGTPFQRAVWAALRETRAGAVESYTRLAQRVGRPRAVRAVGMANGRNPVALVQPCHRVIGASGALTGYAGGLERKRWLLDHEARHAPQRLAS